MHLARHQMKAKCKKDIRTYMGKKCRHVCEMTTSELQAYRQEFAKGVSQDKSYDSDCPCKTQKDAKGKDAKGKDAKGKDAKGKDAKDDDAQPLADQSPGDMDDTDITSGATASPQPGDANVPPGDSAHLTLPPTLIETHQLYSGDAVDLPWLALPGSLSAPGAGGPVGLMGSPTPYGVGPQAPAAANSDLPWIKPAFSAAPSGMGPYPQSAPGFPAGTPGQVGMQPHPMTQKQLDDLTATRRAETEREAAKAFEPDDSLDIEDDDTTGKTKLSSTQPANAPSASDGFLKGFAPAKTFSVSQGELDKLKQGDLSGLEAIKQSLNQTKQNISLDAKQLQDAARRKDLQGASEVVQTLKTDVNTGVQQVKGQQPTQQPYNARYQQGQYRQQQPYDSRSNQGQYRQQQPYDSRSNQRQYRQQQPYDSRSNQGQYRQQQPYDSRSNQGAYQPQGYRPY